MCRDCGCSSSDHGHEHSAHLPHVHAHDYGDVHTHSHTHEHDDAARDAPHVAVGRSLTELNDHLALHNRERFFREQVAVVNLMSSPGAGKTRLLQLTLGDLSKHLRMAAIVGDLATENDARRLRESGAPVVSISTGTMCHLEARMIDRACDELDLARLDLVFIENVGNLVCPASFDLGEGLRVVLMSVTEGEDKPLKYPPMFKLTDVVLVTKTDLAHAASFDRAAALQNIQQVAPQARIIELSARTGEGLDDWYALLEQFACGHAFDRQEAKRELEIVDGAAI